MKFILRGSARFCLRSDTVVRLCPELYVLFHLMDARIGSTGEDTKIIQKMGSIIGSKQQRNHAKYVIVITKNVKVPHTKKSWGG